MAAGGGGGIDEMLERFPNITAADLKPGDMIAVSSTKTGSTDRIKAIKLLAGVEPFYAWRPVTGRGRGQGQGVQGDSAFPVSTASVFLKIHLDKGGGIYDSFIDHF